MDGVQLPQGYSHFEEGVYFLPSAMFDKLTLNTVDITRSQTQFITKNFAFFLQSCYINRQIHQKKRKVISLPLRDTALLYRNFPTNNEYFQDSHMLFLPQLCPPICLQALNWP